MLVGDIETGKFGAKLWKDVHVGTILKIKQDEFFPSDLILLNSSAPKGICYIETKNLDGETNLKHKQGVKDLVEYLTNKEGRESNASSSMMKSTIIDEGNPDIIAPTKYESEILAKMQGGYVECENPNEMLYRFEGTLGMGGERKEVVVPLSNDQMLLRGSSLRNTEYIYGLTVFTGHETKIMKNSVGARSKFSRLETSTNTYIIIIVLLQITISIIGALFNTIWQVMNPGSLSSYLGMTNSDTTFVESIENFLIKFGTWFLMLSNIVPVSLLVTLEIVKFIQAYFIQQDISIYDEQKDMPTKAQSSNLNEELGTVHYIFSDKTGTLT